MHYIKYIMVQIEEHSIVMVLQCFCNAYADKLQARLDTDTIEHLHTHFIYFYACQDALLVEALHKARPVTSLLTQCLLEQDHPRNALSDVSSIKVLSIAASVFLQSVRSSSYFPKGP